MPKTIGFSQAFEELLSRGEQPVVLSFGRADEKAQADPESRRMTFVLSTEEKARDGDVILSSGWKLQNFRKVPVVLAFHDRRRPPVARSLREWVDKERKALLGEAEFISAEKNPDAERLWQMYRDGDMRAVSVSWDPLKWHVEGEGDSRWVVFEEQDLLEYSLVTVPADPRALVLRGEDIICEDGKSSGLPCRLDSRIVIPFGARMVVPEKAFSLPDAASIEDVAKSIGEKVPATEPPSPTRTPGDEEYANERSVVPYSAHGKVPIADRSRPWNAAAARRRLRRWATDGDMIDFGKYRRGFVFVRANGDRLGDYVGPHHDIIGGRFMMVPRGVFALAQRIQQGNIGIPDSDMPAVRRHVEREYGSMGLTAPWKRAAGQHYERLLAEAERDESVRPAVIQLATTLYGDAREPEFWEDTLREDQKSDPVKVEIAAIVTSHLDSDVASISTIRALVDELAERFGQPAKTEEPEVKRLRDPDDPAEIVKQIRDTLASAIAKSHTPDAQLSSEDGNG